jgi:hypothetical protein
MTTGCELRVRSTQEVESSHESHPSRPNAKLNPPDSVLIVGRYEGIIENRPTYPIHLQQALQTDTPASTEALRRIIPL